MLNSSYRKRLARDLERWASSGWVTSEGRTAILADIDGQERPSRLPAIVGILGALLLATGAMTFISANWEEMSKLFRLILIFCAMWAAFGAAVWFQRTMHSYLLEAMLFLGAGMFGVNIMLIAQIYHIDGHYPDAVFLWTIGALVVALALESRSSLALAFVLMTIWTGTEVMEFDVLVHWPFLPVWVVGTAIIFRQKWRTGLHLAVLSIAFWITITLIQLAELWNWPEHQVFGLMAMIAMAVFLIGLANEGRGNLLMGFEAPLMRYAMLAVLAAAFIMQLEIRRAGHIQVLLLAMMAAFLMLVLLGGLAALRRNVLNAPDLAVFIGFAAWLILFTFVPRGLMLWVHGPVYMGFAIWLMAFSQRWSYRILLPMALTAFGAEVLYIYAKTMGNLLDTSLFFLVGGVLLIVLAIGLEKLRRALSGNQPHPGGEGAS